MASYVTPATPLLTTDPDLKAAKAEIKKLQSQLAARVETANTNLDVIGDNSSCVLEEKVE